MVENIISYPIKIVFRLINRISYTNYKGKGKYNSKLKSLKVLRLYTPYSKYINEVCNLI